MKRTPFKTKVPSYTKAERVAPVYARLTVKVNMPRADGANANLPKEKPVRSETYRRLVRKLACIHCGVIGFTQFCHSDEGKGMSIKSDDRTGWPGCGPHIEGGAMVQGCHALIGSTGTFTRDQRRALEADYAARTRKAIRDDGHWPKGMEHMEVQEEMQLI